MLLESRVWKLPKFCIRKKNILLSLGLLTLEYGTCRKAVNIIKCTESCFFWVSNITDTFEAMQMASFLQSQLVIAKQLQPRIDDMLNYARNLFPDLGSWINAARCFIFPGLQMHPNKLN